MKLDLYIIFFVSSFFPQPTLIPVIIRIPKLEKKMATAKILAHLIVIVMVGVACLLTGSAGTRTIIPLEKDDSVEMQTTFFHPFFPPALGYRGGKVIPGFTGGFPSAGAGARATGGSAEGAIGGTGSAIGGEDSALRALGNGKRP